MADANTSPEKFRLYSTTELLGLGAPEWLIDGLFTTKALIGVYGPSGHGKSFLVLDWALSIAGGCEWQGHPVECGPVVYIAAEGGKAISTRVRAWLAAQGVKDVASGFFVLEAVQVCDSKDLDLLAARLKERSVQPLLIVVDTLARCFVGGDENSAQDMGEFIAGLERLRQELDSAVMVVHHTGKQRNELERGSSTLRAAADAMVLVQRKNKIITVKNNKQKDAREFKDISLNLTEISVGEDTSCVLETPQVDTLSSGVKTALMVLAKFPDATASTADWMERAKFKERTLHAHRKVLLSKGLIEEVQRGQYRLTEEGQEVAKAATARRLHLA